MFCDSVAKNSNLCESFHGFSQLHLQTQVNDETKNVLEKIITFKRLNRTSSYSHHPIPVISLLQINVDT